MVGVWIRNVFIKGPYVTSFCFPLSQHRGIYFPPPANGWRSPFLSRTGNVLHASVNQLLHSCLLHRGKSATCYRHSQALTYSILLSTTSQQRPGCQYYWNQRFHNSMDLQSMTTSYCRHSPFLSRKEHRFSCFPLISFRMLALCKKRTFCFIPVICKECTILSRE